MIDTKQDANIIHFYQKVIDATVVGRYTTDFILKIFGIFYKKNHSTGMDSDSNKLVMSIQANLFEKINRYLKGVKFTKDSVIEITFEEDHSIPIINIIEQDVSTDYLIDVFFKKISWDEINEFRGFIIRFLQYYLINVVKKDMTEHKLKQTVSNTAYVIQELLQNANAYSTAGSDYRLKFDYKDSRFCILVENFSDKANAESLINIIDEIKKSDDKKSLILRYMLADQKHLGIITSIFNFGVTEYSVVYDKGLVISNFIIKI